MTPSSRRHFAIILWSCVLSLNIACSQNDSSSSTASVGIGVGPDSEFYDPLEVWSRLTESLRELGVQSTPSAIQVEPIGETAKLCDSLRERYGAGIMVKCQLEAGPDNSQLPPAFNFVPGDYYVHHFNLGNTMFVDDGKLPFFSYLRYFAKPLSNGQTMQFVLTNLPVIRLKVPHKTKWDLERPRVAKLTVEGKAICVEANEKNVTVSQFSYQKHNCQSGSYVKSLDEITTPSELSFILIDTAGNRSEYMAQDGKLGVKEFRDGLDGNGFVQIVPTNIELPKALLELVK